LYLTQSFSSTLGGGEIMFYTIAQKMVERGHQVDVICPKLTNFPAEDLSGASVHRIAPRMRYESQLPPSIVANIGYLINTIIEGSKIIRNRRVQLIHTDSYSSIIAGSLLGKLHQTPTISTIHDVFTTSLTDSWTQWAKENNLGMTQTILGPLLEKIMVRMPTNVIHTISNTSKDDILRLNRSHQSNIIVIHNGIDLAEYGSYTSSSTNKGTNCYDKYIVYIGRLVYYKNLNIVIQAFAAVTKRIPDAKLVVIGEGIKRNDWENLTADLGLSQNIKFLGYVRHDEKLRILSRTSALVLPSLYEGFGIVLIEAFAMRKPVLVAKERPFDEIVDDEVDGFLIPSNDPELWAEKIILMLSEPSLCKRMGEKGGAKVQEKFNIINVISQMERLYRSIAKSI
jgi:glycosyltransferase involved in cell wall biosynthesis